MTISVAGLQLACHNGSPEDNLAAIREGVLAIASQHPETQLVAMPELALSGTDCGAGFFDLGVPWPDGEALTSLAAVAKEAGVILIVGFIEASPAPGVMYNAAALFNSDGSPLGVYRKTHCLAREMPYFVNGCELPVFESSLGRFGVLICWDAAFPEAARVLALQGAEFLVFLGAWQDPYAPDWELVVSARAYDNVLPILAVNRSGHDNQWRFSGHSKLVDCLGKAVAEAGEGENAVFTGVIDLEHTDEVRKGYGSQLRDRNPALYGPLARANP